MGAKPLFLAVAVVSSASCARVAAPHGSALIIVDTDAPVPMLVGWLHVDVLRSDGTQIETREFSQFDPQDWPASFGVYDPDDQNPRDVIVRLRAFPPAADVTMTALVIDRLVRVHLEPAVTGSVRITLRGACFGVPADLQGMRSCAETEGADEPVSTSALVPSSSTPAASMVGEFGKAKCTAATRPAGTAADGTPLLDEEICVDGGAFIFGNADQFGNVIDVPNAPLPAFGDGTPRRIARLPPFRMDKYEVTVARWRAAVAAGFVTNSNSGPSSNENSLGTDPTNPKSCTYSMAPRGREQMAVNCVPWDGARAFCQFLGGDLPTEAEYEYVTQLLGRTRKTAYAWGDDIPSCDRTVFERTSLLNLDLCRFLGTGPPAETDPRADVTAAGFVNMAGGMSEFVIDSFHELSDPCWTKAPLSNPVCVDDASKEHVVRGGSWCGDVYQLAGGWRPHLRISQISPGIGVRCVRHIP